MADDNKKDLEHFKMYEPEESRNRKIARSSTPVAHFPPFDSVLGKDPSTWGDAIKLGDSIDDQMKKVQDFGDEVESVMEKGVYPGEEYKEEHDPVNHPSHYNQFGIECLTAIEASMTPVEYRGYLKGNCQKYIWRYVYKGKPLEDLKKAQFYLNLLIEKVERDGV